MLIVSFHNEPPKELRIIARRRSKRERMAKMHQISLVATAARGPSRRHNMDPRVGFMRFADDDGTVHDGLASTVQPGVVRRIPLLRRDRYRGYSGNPLGERQASIVPNQLGKFAMRHCVGPLQTPHYKANGAQDYWSNPRPTMQGSLGNWQRGL